MALNPTIVSLKSLRDNPIGSNNNAHFKKKWAVRRDLRGVPADVSDENQATATEVAADSLAPIRYAPTGKIRRHIRRLYLQELRGCVFEGRPRRMTLAQAQEYITTMPTISPQLNGEIIKNLTRKKRFSDDELVLLIEYFEKHKGLIESDAVPVKDLTVPGGEKFFFLPSEAMP